MQNLSDDELDKLFQKAAQDLKPGYDADHWKELNTKLDETEKPKGWFNRWGLGLGLAVLLCGSSLLYFTVNNSTPNPNSPLATSLGHEDGIPGKTKNAIGTDGPLPDDQSKSLPESKSTNASGHSELPAVAESDASLSSTVMQRNTKVGPGHSEPPGKYDASEHATNTNRQVSSSSTEPVAIGNTNSHIPPDNRSLMTEDEDEQNKTSNATREANGSSIPDTAELLDQENNSVTTNSGTNDTVSLALAQTKEALTAMPNDGIGREQPATQVEASTLVADSLKTETKPQFKEEPGPTLTEENKEEKSTHSGPRLSLKLSLSPDFSSVGYSRFTKPGTNYGVLAEYHFGNRLSVVTGAIWSKKIYTASDIEYNGHKAYKAEGDCRILDIPINVNYSFRSSGSLSFYAGLGFSSYIMNREDYIFHVKSSYGSTYTYDRKVRGENNEIFSVLNLSVGAQKQVGPRWMLQFEPFVKQSIRGIGDGSLSLSSLGAFLNLRYSLISKQPN